MNKSEKICPENTHILVVDDEEAIRNLHQEKIRDAGYECLIASSAEEALKVLEDKNVDVVLTDINMSGLNGCELTKIVKQKYNSCLGMFILHNRFSHDLIVHGIPGVGKTLLTNAMLDDFERVVTEKMNREIIIIRYECIHRI